MATQDNHANSINARKERIRSDFSKKIGELLIERDITQVKLCLGVTAEFERLRVLKNPDRPEDGCRVMQPWEMSRWALGKVTPDAVAIGAIATVLGVKPDDIVYGMSAEIDPNAIVFTCKQMPDDRYYFEFKGTVDAGTKHLLLRTLAGPEA